VFAQHASDARLELAILGGVDERVDATASKHHNHGEIVHQTRENVGSVADHADECQKVVDLQSVYSVQ